MNANERAVQAAKIAAEEAQFLQQLGCNCGTVQEQHIGENGSYSVQAHYPDCPAVEFFSKPENWPEGWEEEDRELGNA